MVFLLFQLDWNGLWKRIVFNIRATPQFRGRNTHHQHCLIRIITSPGWSSQVGDPDGTPWRAGMLPDTNTIPMADQAGCHRSCGCADTEQHGEKHFQMGPLQLPQTSLPGKVGPWDQLKASLFQDQAKDHDHLTSHSHWLCVDRSNRLRLKWIKAPASQDTTMLINVSLEIPVGRD